MSFAPGLRELHAVQCCLALCGPFRIHLQNGATGSHQVPIRFLSVPRPEIRSTVPDVAETGWPSCRVPAWLRRLGSSLCVTGSHVSAAACSLRVECADSDRYTAWNIVAGRMNDDGGRWDIGYWDRDQGDGIHRRRIHQLHMCVSKLRHGFDVH